MVGLPLIYYISKRNKILDIYYDLSTIHADDFRSWRSIEPMWMIVDIVWVSTKHRQKQDVNDAMSKTLRCILAFWREKKCWIVPDALIHAGNAVTFHGEKKCKCEQTQMLGVPPAMVGFTVKETLLGYQNH